MSTLEREGGQEKPDNLDRLDALLAQFRPIEKLFQLMGAVAPNSLGEASLVRGCSEIGLSLSAQFRESLERTFRRDEDG